jgi:dipeptidase E
MMAPFLKCMKTKKLFLASVAPFVMKRFLEFLPKDPKRLVMGFVATAADPYKDKWFVEEDRKKFKEAGFRLKEVDLKGKNFEELIHDFAEVDIIYVVGGNTFYLLEKTRESNFDKVIKVLLPKGVIYSGSSAGAALVCPSIDYVKYFDDPSKAPNLKSFKGLNLVDFLILPHVGEKDFEKEFNIFQRHKKEYEDKYKIIELTNRQAIVVEGDRYNLLEQND